MSTTTDRNDPRLRKIDGTGQQSAYLVLSDEERSKGFVRPVRTSYTHVVCECSTRMATAIAETYARDPKFYGGTYCAVCQMHFPLRTVDGPQFRWDEPVEGSEFVGE